MSLRVFLSEAIFENQGIASAPLYGVPKSGTKSASNDNYGAFQHPAKSASG
jgi:hypothetical protein